ncbi:hypothetical protein ACYRFS_09230 [Listeria kieliensis]
MEKIQKAIEDTEYWDARVLDITSSYFGDEIQVVFEDEETDVYVLKFIHCYKVSYENSFALDSNIEVCDMNKGQLGYFMQDVSVAKYDKDDKFIKFFLDLSIMTMEIVCKSITVKKVPKNTVSFFWENN